MSEDKLVPLEMSGSIVYDFARHYYSGQFSTLYRIMCSGMLVSDLEEVKEQHEQAQKDNDGDDNGWNEVLMCVEDELREIEQWVKQDCPE